jgi:predicted membrane protein
LTSTRKQSDSERRRRFELGPVIAGVVLITLGVLFLLDQAGSIDAGTLIGDWWPLVIVAIGLVQLAERPRSPVGPLIVTGFGLILLLTQLELISGDVWSYVWPVFLVVVGLVIIFRLPGRNPPAGRADDVVQTSALFGNNELVVTSQRFQGGAVTAIFGGVSLDLRQANLDPEGATLAGTAVFGAIDVLVPRGWRVEANGTPIFGGVSNQVQPAEPGTPTLRLDATVIFGGATIKHDK